MSQESSSAAPEPAGGVRLLLIDNYDSFTYNLFQILAELAGVDPVVLLNDEALPEDLSAFDGVVLSPGPGHPARGVDVGSCVELLRRFEGPVLGVCLGHQLMGQLAGAVVAHAPEPMHGRDSEMHHDGDALFEDIPERFHAIRYHSLLLEGPLPEPLRAIAWTDDELIMGLRVTGAPRWGVQFHPESFASPFGRALLKNFVAACGTPGAREPIELVRDADVSAARCHWRRLELPLDPEVLYRQCFAETASSFWLDGASATEPRRYSYLGTGTTSFEHRAGQGASLWERLSAGLDGPAADAPPLPFVGGFVGALGYELKGECGARSTKRGALPDVMGMWVERFVAIDHEMQQVLGVARGEESEAEAWFRSLEAMPVVQVPANAPAPFEGYWGEDPRCRWRQPLPRYRESIAACLDAIRDGESYELCLTNQLLVDGEVDPLELFVLLRRSNPAPHAALVRVEGCAIVSSSPEQFLRADAAGELVCRPIKGTSPRGADPREDAALAEALRCSEKNRAENLMIVDLLRNDLGRSSVVGSVRVDAFAAVESYATVHQLVSTIRGQLHPDLTVLDAIRAAFPGGSMTGAPKLRSMEILDELEGGARGPYSGSIGFIGHDGAADLNIVIRSVVVEPGRASIGAGGAIVALSDPDEEIAEMELKADAPVRALLGLLDAS